MQLQEASSKKLPPMLVQYLEYKEKYPECLLLFQVGDFYEAFFDDAKILASTLNLTLTSRDKSSESPIPMAGMPILSVDNYIDRLIQEKFSVALVSQVSQPSGKGMVDRELERIVTPGVQVLSSGNNNLQDSVVGSIYFSDITSTEVLKNSEISFVYAYPESGEVFVFEDLDKENLLLKISQILPVEIILAKEINGKKLDRRFTFLKEIERVCPGVILRFRSETSSLQKVKDREFMGINGYAGLNNCTRLASKLLINYIDEITVSSKISINSITNEKSLDYLLIDSSTRQNLELIKNQKSGSKQGSLFGFLDKTITAGGQRLLKQWILRPSSSKQEIELRKNSVKIFLDNVDARKQVKSFLHGIGDLDRLASRIELNVINPKEMGILRDSLLQIKQIVESIKSIRANAKSHLANFNQEFSYPNELLEALLTSLSDDPPLVLKDGNVFKENYNSELDRIRNLRSNSKILIGELEDKERSRTTINTLKIRNNNLQGYYFEVTKSHITKVPQDFIRKQSTVNSERYYTTELKKLEEEILSAEFLEFDLEKKLFEQLKAKVTVYTKEIREVYKKISILDVFINFAEIAESFSYVEPEIVEAEVLDIIEGQHPVIADIIKNDFVPNSLKLDSSEKTCLILTGPNMGGKSTYLRQTALIIIMAQLGSYVPAKSARIGVVDKLFARIGASDDLLEGDSTFMVEMREAGLIISTATKKSVILVDELGRGTATTDGQAIARSILEWIITNLRSRTLFATHFHQLTELDRVYSQVVNFSVGSIEIEDQVVFTHEICKGPAKNSYGLEVAKMAGLPEMIIERAYDLLAIMEKEDKPKKQLSLFDQLQKAPLLQKKEETKKDLEKEKLLKLKNDLQGIDVNQMKPVDAIIKLNEIINQAKDAN